MINFNCQNKNIKSLSETHSHFDMKYKCRHMCNAWMVCIDILTFNLYEIKKYFQLIFENPLYLFWKVSIIFKSINNNISIIYLEILTNLEICLENATKLSRISFIFNNLFLSYLTTTIVYNHAPVKMLNTNGNYANGSNTQSSGYLNSIIFKL